MHPLPHSAWPFAQALSILYRPRRLTCHSQALSWRRCFHAAWQKPLLLLCFNDFEAFLGPLLCLRNPGNFLDNRGVFLYLHSCFSFINILNMFILHVLAGMNEFAYLCMHRSQIHVPRSACRKSWLFLSTMTELRSLYLVAWCLYPLSHLFWLTITIIENISLPAFTFFFSEAQKLLYWESRDRNNFIFPSSSCITFFHLLLTFSSRINRIRGWARQAQALERLCNYLFYPTPDVWKIPSFLGAMRTPPP